MTQRSTDLRPGPDRRRVDAGPRTGARTWVGAGLVTALLAGLGGTAFARGDDEDAAPTSADPGTGLAQRLQRDSYTADFGRLSGNPAHRVRNKVLPKVSGRLVVGSVLTATSGGWAPSDVKVAYQWFAGGAPIAGATGPTYTIHAKTQGKRLAVEVTATRKGYRAASADSAATRAVRLPGIDLLARPRMSGTAGVGSVLSASTGRWSVRGTRIGYRWLRDGKVVAGATGARYRLVAADRGHRMWVVVVATHRGYEPGVARVGPSARVRRG